MELPVACERNLTTTIQVNNQKKRIARNKPEKNPGRAKKSETGPPPGETEKRLKQAGQEEKPQTQPPVDIASTGVYINL